MPLVSMKVPVIPELSMEDCSEPRSKGNRRSSSSIKHAFSSILRTGSVSGPSHSNPKINTSGTPPSRSGWDVPPRAFYGHDDYSVVQNELSLTHNNETAINGEDFDEADIESDECLSELDDLQSYYGSSPARNLHQASSSQRYLINYLSERGFLQPKLLCSKGNVTICTATSSEIVFLPTISSQDDEYMNHLAMLANADMTADGVNSLSRSANPSEVYQPQNNDTNSYNSVPTETFTSHNPEQGSLDADGKNVLFNIALIVSVKQATSMSTIKAELFSRARIYWQHGVPPEKDVNEEYYNIGELKWDLTCKNFNLYVPHKISPSSSIIERQDQVIDSCLFKNNESLECQAYLQRRKSKQHLLESLDSNPEQHLFQAGDYVFLLPIFFSNNIPETVYLPSGRVNYNFRCALKMATTGQNDDTRSEASSSSASASTLGSEEHHADTSSHLKFPGNTLLKKVRNHLQNHSENNSIQSKRVLHGSYPIPVVRIPPVMSISTADKPVYINRIWNDALSYEVSLSKKYIPIGSDLPIKIKLLPLVKKISIKRVRVSILEKITFVSKNLEYEFDQTEAISKDPYSPYYSEFACRRKQERILPLLEVRARERGSRAIREEVLDNCRSDNLLSPSTALANTTDKNFVETIEPLTIETTVRFPKYSVLDKRSSRNIPPYGIDEFTTTHQQLAPSTSRRGSTTSGVIGLFAGRRPSTAFRSRNNSLAGPETLPSTTKFKTSSNINLEWHTRINEPKRGLYLDSVNFKNIHVKHKLEIMLRISRPDPDNQGQEKHYEVLIDTPVFLVSELCTNENIELPTYDMATKGPSNFDQLPPSFEQAISVPASPVGSPMVSPIGSPHLAASYDVDDLSIQQLSLSRVSTQNGTDRASPEVTGSAGRRYSNLDYLLNQPTKNQINRPIFGDEYQLRERTGIAADNAVFSDDEPPKYAE